MQVKRFIAQDMPQALKQIRQDLGPEAVILSTGRRPDGSVEISAAVEAKAAGQSAPPPARPAGEAPLGPTALSALARRVEGLGAKLDKHMLVSEAAEAFSQRPEVMPIYDHLVRQEVSEPLIAQLLDDLSAPDGVGLLPRLTIRLKKLLQVSGAPQMKTGGPVIWALVGPTGVGKTTTAAKLAARFALRHRLSVGMITVDTFRMAAAEQLKVYGQIMEVPTLVASSGPELIKAVDELSGKDLILVDTVGRAPGDSQNLEELAQVLGAVAGIQSHLVLSCPTRNLDQQAVMQGFEVFNPQSLIFTKLDETAVFGPILNRVAQSGLAVSYITFGQKVPDDLEEASLESLARRLLPPRETPNE